MNDFHITTLVLTFTMGIMTSLSSHAKSCDQCPNVGDGGLKYISANCQPPADSAGNITCPCRVDNTPCTANIRR